MKIDPAATLALISTLTTSVTQLEDQVAELRAHISQVTQGERERAAELLTAVADEHAARKAHTVARHYRDAAEVVRLRPAHTAS